MALTFVKATDTPNEPQTFGQFKALLVDLTPDNSYPTGGYALTLAQLGLNHVVGVISLGGGVSWTYDAANAKLKAFSGATGLQIANAVDLSANLQRVMIIGY